MNKRFVFVLIFATVVALAVSSLLYKAVMNRQQQQPAAQAAVKIAVASKDLDVGAVIKEDDVKLDDWTGPVPEGSSSHPKELVGRGVITPIMAKEPVIEKRLAPAGAGGGFSVLIPQGYRAVPLRVNEVAGVAGFVVAGMHVDVLISGNSPGSDNRMGTVTKTLLQDVTVLSAGQDFKKDPEGKPEVVQVITVLATPEQAEQLSLASAQTTVQLSLRNPLDKTIAKTPGTALARLFNGKTGFAPDGEPVVPRVRQAPEMRVALPVARKEPAFVMEIISGTTRKEAKFDTPGEGK
ncbi:MAG TPA: Flp pilus assembly protein CpaB [Bryobacteraceae bacterium]|jgi:pilus assembly protein CpaB